MGINPFILSAIAAASIQVISQNSLKVDGFELLVDGFPIIFS